MSDLITQLLTEEQTEKLILAFAKGRKTSFHESEAFKVLDWACETLIEYCLLQMVFDGELLLDYKKVDGKRRICFRKINGGNNSKP